MIITINGASDDLIEVFGCEDADEFDVGAGGRWQADLVAPGGLDQMRVHCWFDDDGCWQVGVGQTVEECQLPPWPITITQAPRSYSHSARLTVSAPPGTRLTNIRP